MTDAKSIFDYDADIIVTQRYAIPDLETADALAAHAGARGATLVFDLDDDLLNIPRNHPGRRGFAAARKVVRRMLDVADARLASRRQALAESLSALRPDAVGDREPAGRAHLDAAPPGTRRRSNPVRILCMGTTTHDRDFAMIEPALLRLKAEYGDRIVIDILGMTGRRSCRPDLNRIGPSTNAVPILSRLRQLADLGAAALAYRLGAAARHAVQPLQIADQGDGLCRAGPGRPGLRHAGLSRLDRRRTGRSAGGKRSCRLVRGAGLADP